MRTFRKYGVGLCTVLTLLASSPAMAHVPHDCIDEAKDMANLATLAGAAAQAAARAGARGDHAMAEEFLLHYFQVQEDFVEKLDETWRCIAR